VETLFAALPGLRLAYVTKPCIVLTGIDGCTVTMFGVMPMRVTAAISRTWSYGGFENNDMPIALEAMLH